MSGASTLPGCAGKGFGGLQSGGASRADANLEGGAVKAWLEETCLVLECARSLDGELKVCVGKDTVRTLVLAVASLSGLCACFCARLGGSKSHVNPSLSSSKLLPSSSTDTAGRKMMLNSA